MTDAAAERRRVRALIERAGVAMLMNVDEHGTHIGRPMLPLFLATDPHIYFLTHQSSRKVAQLAARSQVGLTIISANMYVAIAGSAHISRDPKLIRPLWRRRIARGFLKAKTIARPLSSAW
jgi:general stress protein 26